jgi:two-component system alkaline phosphatase synthesis response regulator PhoP
MTHRERILVVDDNATNRDILDARLTATGYEVMHAGDGEEALAMAMQHFPDLILLDIMMPKLSGFEVCKKLKDDPQSRKIMILMVTALSEWGDIERAVEAGTDDFLSKPVNKVELLTRVRNMLKLRHVEDEVERLRRYIDEIEDQGGPQ